MGFELEKNGIASFLDASSNFRLHNLIEYLIIRKI